MYTHRYIRYTDWLEVCDPKSFCRLFREKKREFLETNPGII